MAVLGAGPRETLMIGDTSTTCRWPATPGVPGLAVSYGVHEPGRLLAEAPWPASTGSTSCRVARRSPPERLIFLRETMP